VPVCLVTHGHSDHAREGHRLYISATDSLEILKHRLGTQCNFQTTDYNQKFKMKNCWVSFHPAGHILGSSQIRIETEKCVCVISGDYKRSLDPTCAPFEVVPCDVFVTESTFALPIYHWEPSALTATKIYNWWQENRSHGMNSVLFCYALGKAQRIMSLLAQITDSPVYLHGAIYTFAKVYEKSGVPLGRFFAIEDKKGASFNGDLIIAPPQAGGSPWLRHFDPYKTAFASGWMQVRGIRKQRNVDCGFVLSDHADWSELLTTIKETQASTILTTHGNAHTLARYLQEQNIHALPLKGMEVMEEGEG
jgi:putative mRNA 3-end processing factor